MTTSPDQDLKTEAVVTGREDPTDAGFASRIDGCDAPLFMSPTWLGVLAATYGFQFDAITASSGAGTSAIPLALISDARGRRVRSLPFSDAAMFPLADPDHWPALEAELLAFDAPVTLAVKPGAIPFGEAWDLSQPWVWQQIDVTGSEEDLWARYSSNTRNRVRRPAKDGFECRWRQDPQAIDDFFELHLGVRRNRHHLLAQPRSLFANLADAFWGPDRLEPDLTDGAVVTIERDGVVAAACVVARYGDTAYYKFSASHPDYRRVMVNQAVVHGASCWAQAVGCDRLDMGRSDVDQPGLITFKEHLGARGTGLVRAALGGRPDPAAEQLGATLGRLTGILLDDRVPDQVVEAAGAELYRYFA